MLFLKSLTASSTFGKFLGIFLTAFFAISDAFGRIVESKEGLIGSLKLILIYI